MVEICVTKELQMRVVISLQLLEEGALSHGPQGGLIWLTSCHLCVHSATCPWRRRKSLLCAIPDEQSHRGSLC